MLAPLLACSQYKWLFGLSVNVSSDFFQIATRTVFRWFSRNLAHIIYEPVYKKTVEQVFEMFILIFGKFLKFRLRAGFSIV